MSVWDFLLWVVVASVSLIVVTVAAVVVIAASIALRRSVSNRQKTIDG